MEKAARSTLRAAFSFARCNLLPHFSVLSIALI